MSNSVYPRLKKRYHEEIRKSLQNQLGFGNIMQVPTLIKVVINIGVGEAARDSKLINAAIKDLMCISGQKPAICKSRKSIAQFKLREGMLIGARVTLRNNRMWEFLDKLISIALPRIRDFRGLNAEQFDQSGNYTFGLNEQSMFHEIDADSIERSRGMNITLVTSASNNKEGYMLLKSIGFPFKEK